MNDLLINQRPEQSGPVECLGLTFPNDQARREHFLAILREKLKDPAFRQIEGFPIGSDEDILAMSDPPYYTACPNPFLEEFVRRYGKPYDPNVPYSHEPLTVDVSVGKTNPIYLLALMRCAVATVVRPAVPATAAPARRGETWRYSTASSGNGSGSGTGLGLASMQSNVWPLR